MDEVYIAHAQYTNGISPFTSRACYSLEFRAELSIMSDCCSTPRGTESPKKHRCPVNGVECSRVTLKTLLHHIKMPWTWREKKQGYYFCEDPNCDVVYFGEDDSVVTKAEVRTSVGVKETSKDALICYCFGISKADLFSNPSLKSYVTKNTQAGLCSCETSNPSGRCCLKDFRKNEAL